MDNNNVNPNQRNDTGFFPSNQAALQSEQQRIAMAANPSLQPISNSTFQGHKPVKWILSVIFLLIALVSAVAFAYWAFSERQTYKNDSDKLVATAVVKAEKDTTAANNKKFAEELKNPLTTYIGPSSYGSISVEYPKTWSAYVKDGGTGSTPFEAYFHPAFVPNVDSSKDRKAVALHIEVVSQSYDKVVFARDANVKSGKLTAAPYALKKNPEQVGTIFQGEIENEVTGMQIVLPLRDKTIVITTESNEFMADIQNNILPNLSFIP